MSTGPDNPLDALSRTAVLSDTPRTDALAAKIITDGPTRYESIGMMPWELAKTLERELAEAKQRIKSLEDGSAETSIHLISAGIPSFGWNWEGVDKLAIKLRTGEQYAGHLQALLREWLEHTVSEITEADGQWADGWIDRVRAALATNPRGVGHSMRAPGSDDSTPHSASKVEPGWPASQTAGVAPCLPTNASELTGDRP